MTFTPYQNLVFVTNNTTTNDDDWGNNGSGAELGPKIIEICGIFSLLATIISLLAMLTHLKNYTKPHLQRFVIRIKWMIPVYAISSWISLISLKTSFYLDAIRDIYEAFVIYCFFALMVNYMGGERGLLSKLYGREPIQHMWPAYYFSKEMEVGDPYSFLFLKRGILQYVYIKPIIAIVTMILKYKDQYDENDLSIYTKFGAICYSSREILTMGLDGRPLAKFLCVKAIVFFSFWQGLVISALVSTGLVRLGNGLSEEHTAVALQDALICIELLFGALAHLYAFTYQDYQPKRGPVVRLKLYYAMRDAIGMRDIIQDSLETYSGSDFNYRTFEPAVGAPVTDSGLNNRLRAGLRYSHNGQHKYWLRRTNSGSTTPLTGGDGFKDEIRFDDALLDRDIEDLYENSRHFAYGDYNIPTIESELPVKYQRPTLVFNSPPRRLSRIQSRIEQSDTNHSSHQSSLKANSTEAIVETIHTQPIGPNPAQHQSPVIARAEPTSNSVIHSPWDSPRVRAKDDWQDELLRLQNREAVNQSQQIDSVLDPWR